MILLLHRNPIEQENITVKQQAVWVPYLAFAGPVRADRPFRPSLRQSFRSHSGQSARLKRPGGFFQW
jgi:hypothetical protein